MALVGEVVARFKAETGEYLSKIDAAKAKNKELATQLIATAGSADKAMAALQVAKGKGALGDFGVDPRQVSGIVKEIKALDQEARKASEGAGGLFKQIKSIAGEESALGNVGKLLAGTGAVAGVSMVVGSIEKATAKAVELRDQFNSGKITAGQFADQLARSIPIAGDIYGIFANTKELLTGENAALARRVELWKQTQKAAQEAFDAHKKATEANEEFKGKFAQDFAYRDRGLAADRLRQQGKTGSADKAEIQTKVDKQLDSDLEGIRKNFGDQIKAAEKELEGAGALTSISLREEIDKLKKEQAEAEKAAITSARAARDSELRSKLGGKTAEQADAENLNKKIGKQLTEGIQSALKGSSVGEFADRFGKDMVKGIEKNQGGFLSFIEGGKDRVKEREKKAKLDENLTDKAKGLLKEKAEIEKEMQNPGYAYNLPDVKELRGGQSLVVPPTKVDEKQLERLGEINQNLIKLKSEAKTGGVVIEEIS